MVKGYKFVVLYLVIALGLHFFYRAQHSTGSLRVVEFVSVMFAVFCLIKLRRAPDTNAKLSCILTSVLFLTFVAKLEYRFYNIFVVLSLVLLSIYCIVKMNLARPLREEIMGISFVVLVVAFVPDKMFLAYTHNALLTRGEQVTWEDFKAEPDAKSTWQAHIQVGLLNHVSKGYNYPPGHVLSYMEPNESWVRDRTEHPAFNLLLCHEQGHFYIAEYCAQLANDSLRTTWGRERKANLIIAAFYHKMDSLQVLYDSLTDHGRDVAAQFEWTRKLKRELGVPSLPTDIENVP